METINVEPIYVSIQDKCTLQIQIIFVLEKEFQGKYLPHLLDRKLRYFLLSSLTAFKRYSSLLNGTGLYGYQYLDISSLSSVSRTIYL
jgi:hypothetical protein